MSKAEFLSSKQQPFVLDNFENIQGYDLQQDGTHQFIPKKAFEANAESLENSKLSFSAALRMIRRGCKVSRAGWNGKGMFLFLVPGSTFVVNRPPLLGIYPEGTTVSYHAHIDMKTATGDIVPWLASQTDLLADDWCIVE